LRLFSLGLGKMTVEISQKSVDKIYNMIFRMELII
jgi:hypothetical protein